MTAQPATPGPVSVEYRGPIAIVRYTNPPTGLISNKGAALLHTALAPLLDAAAVRAIVLTGGESGVFIRHADVSQIRRAADALASGQITPESFVDAPFPRLGQLLDSAPKPVIAAINGTCMGGGFEIALACTLRVASAEVAAIGLPEIRLGIFPGAGGTQRLPALIGQSRARLFMLQGEVVTAREALTLGLVDEVAPCALTRAMAIAEQVSRRSAAAVTAILELTRTPLESALANEARCFGSLLRDDTDVRAQLARFAEARIPLEQLP